MGQYNSIYRVDDPPPYRSQSAVFNEVKQSLSSFIEQLDKDSCSLSEYAVPSNSNSFGMDRDYRSTRDEQRLPVIHLSGAVQPPCNLETELQSISIDGGRVNLNSEDPHQQIHGITIAPTPSDEQEIPSWSTSILDQDIDLAAIFGAKPREAVTAAAAAADSDEPSVRRLIDRCDEDKGELLRHHLSTVQTAANGFDDQLFESRSMKNRIVALEKQNKHLSNQLEEAQAEIQRLHQSNDRLVADTASKIDQERSRYRADLTQLSSKHLEEVQSKQHLHDKLEHLHELKSDYETLLAEKHGLEAKVDKARDESVGVRNDLSNAKAELNKVKAELQRGRLELEESRADCSGLRAEGSRLVKELGDARSAADQQGREWGGEKKWLEEQLQALRQDLNERIQIIGRMNNELMGLRQDSNAVQQRVASSGEQLGRELQQAQQLISSLERELRDAREGMARRSIQNPTGNTTMPVSSSLATHPYHPSINAHSSARSSIHDGYNAPSVESSVNQYRNMNSSAEASHRRSSSGTSLGSVVTTRGPPTMSGRSSSTESSSSSTSYEALRPPDFAFRSPPPPPQSAYAHPNSATTTASSISVAYHADQPFGIDKSTSLSSLIDSRRASVSRHPVSSSSSYSDTAAAQYGMNAATAAATAVVRSSPFATEATSALINQRFDNLDRVLTTLMTEKTALQDEAERYVSTNSCSSSVQLLPYPTLPSSRSTPYDTHHPWLSTDCR